MDHKKFLVLVALMSAMIGCCAAVVIYSVVNDRGFIRRSPSAEEISNSFLAALKNGDYQAAFDLCDPALQAELIDPSNFQIEIERYQIQPLGWETVSKRSSPDQAELVGSMEFLTTEIGSFRIILRKHAEDWKVAMFFLDR
jgi:hypothetical protein